MGYRMRALSSAATGWRACGRRWAFSANSAATSKSPRTPTRVSCGTKPTGAALCRAETRCRLARGHYYIATAEGWLYLAGVKDQCTCEIVGYAMGARMTQELAISALNMAIHHRHPAPGLIHHSDRGSQYCAKAYRAILQRSGLVASMSRKGNSYNNAPIESFWGSLKNEMVHHQCQSPRKGRRCDRQ